jgi:anthranilate phosphoribosyltransferase
MSNFNLCLQAIAKGLTLNSEQAFAALAQMQAEETPATQRAAFLAMLALRGETAEELTGFLQYIQQQAKTITLDATTTVIDIVGTGGDNLKTFNISTAASLIVASAGITVAKHGGRSVTSLSGSADVLEALNIPLLEQPKAVADNLRKYHFAFLFAPHFNPLLKQISALRRELGLRTFFNVLAPLANPAQVKRQVIGLYTAEVAPTVIAALKNAGSVHAMAVHSFDGMDEISLSSPTQIVQLKNSHIKKYTVKPEDFGLKTCHISEVTGGDAKENAQILKDIFWGRETGPKRDIVLLNAAAGFIVADRVSDFAAGIALAQCCIENGSVQDLLNKFYIG